VRIPSVFSRISTCVAQVVHSNAGSVFSCSVPERRGRGGGGQRHKIAKAARQRCGYERILFMIVVHKRLFENCSVGVSPTRQPSRYAVGSK
jgi:hypothetical protein